MGKAEYNMLEREREIVGTFSDKQEENIEIVKHSLVNP